jgi:hypothetical protein
VRADETGAAVSAVLRSLHDDARALGPVVRAAVLVDGEAEVADLPAGVAVHRRVGGFARSARG